ncbi:MAG: DUF4097 domain-containing protein [Lachnospiraceae bacterium]|nr:DUF4097 domain-containing protein [Lachnospiraceae bacterium]
MMRKIKMILAAAVVSAFALGGCGIFTGTAGVVEDTVELKNFDTVDIEVRSVDVMLTRGDSFQLSYRTEKGKEPVIEEKDGRLTVRQPSKLLSLFSFRFDLEKDVYTITVPGNYDQEISLRAQAASGDVMIDRVKVSGEVEAQSGDVLFNDLEGAKLSAQTKSGDIGCDKVKMTEVSFEASSGNVEILRLFTDELSAETSSGDVEINNSEIKNIVCESSSGDVEIGLLGDKDDYSCSLHTSSGRIEVNDEEYEDSYEKDGGDGSIRVKTSSGDIEISM